MLTCRHLTPSTDYGASSWQEVVIVELHQGCAAEKSGKIKVGDYIIAAKDDKKSCEVKDDASGSQEVIDVIKGRQGSHVILTVGRDEPQNECKLMVGAHVRVQDLKFQVLPHCNAHTISPLNWMQQPEYNTMEGVVEEIGERISVKIGQEIVKTGAHNLVVLSAPSYLCHVITLELVRGDAEFIDLFDKLLEMQERDLRRTHALLLDHLASYKNVGNDQEGEHVEEKEKAKMLEESIREVQAKISSLQRSKEDDAAAASQKEAPVDPPRPSVSDFPEQVHDLEQEFRRRYNAEVARAAADAAVASSEGLGLKGKPR
ncbi:hypothetical protein GUITHDRAFT_144269 [Guillardia theta CCMP2712]|uniref:PDZ domain-containing protein n=1 Tax=Guillardia theta (strain CCMP2712) TaxID=905079 RepID=L1IQ06_GUITC|nr:hypothetical protein GUITHDRAFT_144269 [Guillardia theta CCMP2712]EKX38323.1 hypothetical protein GUITHDRAFT_144269 [Guillardia theta CCMP2712]|eukprot:XP_005825303.1 hypothetical protein GUITHDRAFT_144269 [Guillardia theta CCMP2712]